MKINPASLISRCLIAMALAASFSTLASAQNGNIRSITFVTIKPDRIGDFQAELKEVHALMKKDKSTRYSSIWMSLTGPREYAIVSYHNKWSALDEGADTATKDDAADLARLQTRMIDCASSWRRTIDVIQPDLSLPQTSTEMPKMVRVLTTLVRADKYQEYLDLIKSDVLPAAKKGGLTTYLFSETKFGAPNTQVTSVIAMDKWAELDEPFGIEKALGKDDYKALLGKVRPLIIKSEVNEYRFQPELSYLPAAPAK
jgi:hypothetical protein